MSRKILNRIAKASKNEDFKRILDAHGVGIGSHSESIAARNMQMLLNLQEGKVRNATEARITRYSSEITPFLYPDNSFIKYSKNDAGFAASGDNTQTAEAADGPTVTKGRVYATSLLNGDNAPVQTVKVRKNNKKDWAMEYFHTEPTVLSQQETTAEVAYNTRLDALQSHANELSEAVANFTAVEWAQGEVGVALTVNTTQGTDNQVVFTSGAARPNTVAGTGTIKKIVLADMKAVKSAFFKQQILNGASSGKIYFLPTVEQYNDLLSIPEFVDFEKTGRESRLLKGEVGTILDIIVLNPRHRADWGGASVAYSYTALGGVGTVFTDLTKIEDTATVGANMVAAGLIWTENNVRRAEGTAVVFPWMNSPLHFGDVYAVEQRYTADKKRSDGNGVIMLVENPF